MKITPNYMGPPMAQVDQAIGFAPRITMDENEHDRLGVPNGKSLHEMHKQNAVPSAENVTRVKSEGRNDLPVTDVVIGEADESFGAIDSALGESLSDADHREAANSVLTSVAQLRGPRRRGRPPGIKIKEPSEGCIAQRGSQTPSMSDFRNHGNGLVHRNGVSFESPQRQLFKGQRAMRSRPGFGLPGLPLKSPAGAVHIGGPDRRIALGESQDSSFNELVSCCDGVPALVKIFNDLIYPSLIALKNTHQDALSGKALMVICIRVSSFSWTIRLIVQNTDRDTKLANETVDDKFKAFLKETDYHLTEIQKTLIERYIRRQFARKIKRALKEAEDCPGTTGSHTRETRKVVKCVRCRHRKQKCVKSEQQGQSCLRCRTDKASCSFDYSTHLSHSSWQRGQHKGRTQLSLGVNESPEEGNLTCNTFNTNSCTPFLSDPALTWIHS